MAGDFNLMEAQRAVLHMDALSSSAKLVAFAVFSFWSTKSPRPYPGTATLQRLTRLSKPTVMRAIRELVAAQVVNVATDESVHGQRFVFDLEPVMKLDRSKNSTGQIEGHKPVKNRSKTGKGHFTNQHQNGSISTEGIQEEIHKKEPITAPLRGTVKSDPEKQPPGTAELRDHYVVEFQRTRNVNAGFGNKWGRAMKSFGLMITEHGIDDAKRIVTRGLEQQATPTYTPLVDPWDLAKRANSLKGSGPQATFTRQGRMGVQVDSTMEELAEHSARVRAVAGRPSWLISPSLSATHATERSRATASSNRTRERANGFGFITIAGRRFSRNAESVRRVRQS